MRRVVFFDGFAVFNLIEADQTALEYGGVVSRRSGRSKTNLFRFFETLSEISGTDQSFLGSIPAPLRFQAR
jgi:hypothetical protein